MAHFGLRVPKKPVVPYRRLHVPQNLKTKTGNVNTNKNERDDSLVSKMASDRRDAVLLGLLVKKINDYEPNLVKEIQAIVDILGAAVKHFEKVFGKSLKSFLNGYGNLDLQQQCDSEEKLKAVARVIATNFEIDGWNGILDLRSNHIVDIDAIGKALITNNTLNKLYLGNNDIVHIDTIGKALETNNTLNSLYLYNNQIVDIDTIGKALETNNTLKKL